MYDVVVIGGGPVGSQVAYRLAEMGYRAVVLERKERLGEQVCCTGIISQECVNTFAVDDDVILRQLNSAQLYSPSGGLLRLCWKEPQAYIIDRAAFDVAMASRAKGVGVEYILNSPATNVEVEVDRVRVKAGRQFEARAAIIATGFSSRLSEQFGLGRFGDFVTGAQAEVSVSGVDEVEIYFGQEIAPGFFGWLVPTSSQTALVGLLSRRNPGLYLGKLVSSLQAQGKVASVDAEPSYGGIPLTLPARTYGERILVVGGAAGQVKPITGGGIYYGLLCAEIAASSLEQALKSDGLSARCLAGYEREWKSKLGRELRIGYYARKFYERLSDGQIDRMFDIIQSNGIDETLLRAEGLSFDWHGKIVLQLLRQRAMFTTVMKFPFYLIPLYLRGRV